MSQVTVDVGADLKMALNKKQKKQIEAIKKKLEKHRQLLTFAKQQNDDPGEVVRLQSEIDALEAERKQIQES